MAAPSRLQELYDNLRFSQGSARASAPTGSSDDPFILKLANLIFCCAAEMRASDIHIEPTRLGARIRYRIDGMLHEMLQLPVEVGDPLLRAIKVKSNLANEPIGRSKPQDGRIEVDFESRKLDLRVSSFPTLLGDVLSFRILDRSAPLRNIDQLGMPSGVLKEFDPLIHRPNGLILVTGLGGSGKTTTLYAALNTLKSSRIKIVTLEDPIEIEMDGLAQAQINPALGVTFASGLRAILRQDTNIIFVGEIRDRETAEIAIRAALTGHLVFSTIHTRHSLGAILRLVDMGIELHLIMAALSGVMAQRLVRVVCRGCAAPDLIAEQTAARLWSHETSTAPPAGLFAHLRKGSGCAACAGSGYQGRVGVFELLVLTEELRRLVFSQPPSELYPMMVKSGKLKTMLIDGLQKTGQGITTLEEVLRVIGEMEES